QLDVEHEHLRLLRPRQPERVGGRGALDDLVPFGSQHTGDGVAVARIVVDDDYLRALAHPRSSSRTDGARPARGASNPSVERTVLCAELAESTPSSDGLAPKLAGGILLSGGRSSPSVARGAFSADGAESTRSSVSPVSLLGSTTSNVEPLPSSLSTRIPPPTNAASFRDNGNPRPVPRTHRCAGESICVNSSKIRSWSSGAMPMPVSATANTMVSFGPRRAVTWILPRSVYLIAFEIKFLRICDTF